MKRYEKMSNEEMLKFLSENSEGKCSVCKGRKYCSSSKVNCTQAISMYLSEELPKKTVSRWQTIKCDEDFAKMYKEQNHICNTRGCGNCPYSDSDDCEIAYYVEKIEVDDDDIRRSKT